MGNRVRVFQVDAFTDRRFSGNPAGVVLDADALSGDDMQALARELNNGDTAFLLRPDAADHDLRVRFFTPRREAAFVGHATIAAHAVLATLQLAPRRRQKQSSGIVEVDATGGRSPPRIAIHLPPPQPPRDISAQQLGAVLEALTLTRAELDAQCPPMLAGAGSGTRLLLGIEQGTTLARLAPDATRLLELSGQTGAPGYFLFSRRPSVADVDTEARMFCPAIGIPEDPVSGNAHALLGAYLLHHRLLGAPAPGLPRASIGFTGAQGHHMGRPGRVTIALQLAHDRLESASIVGDAVVVFDTTLEF
jgi:PhzF family phenazine biosynthesis protein